MIKIILKHVLIILIISFFSFLPWLYSRYRTYKNKNITFSTGNVPLVSSCPRCRVGVKKPEWVKIKVIDKF